MDILSPGPARSAPGAFQHNRDVTGHDLTAQREAQESCDKGGSPIFPSSFKVGDLEDIGIANPTS